MSRVRANKLVNRAGTGAPQLTYGAEIPAGYGLTGAGNINLTGSVTITGIYASGISTFTQNINLRDNVKANFGDGDDLRIYHDGTNSYVEDTGTGNLYLSGSTDVIIQHHSTGETMAKFTGNGASELYYDNSKKFETTGVGATVTGTLYATTFIGNGSQLTGIAAGGGGSYNELDGMLFG
jgi:hypothetical protein